MAQQTAVEWLQNQLKFSVFADREEGMTYLDSHILFEMLAKAKQMEKEQIMKAVYDSMGTNFDPNMGRAELYYNETYNKD